MKASGGNLDSNLRKLGVREPARAHLCLARRGQALCDVKDDLCQDLLLAMRPNLNHGAC